MEATQVKHELSGWYKPLGAVLSTLTLAGLLAYGIGKLAGFQTVGDAQAASIQLEQRVDAKLDARDRALGERLTGIEKVLQVVKEQNDMLLRAHMPSPRTKE